MLKFEPLRTVHIFFIFQKIMRFFVLALLIVSVIADSWIVQRHEQVVTYQAAPRIESFTPLSVSHFASVLDPMPKVQAYMTTPPVTYRITETQPRPGVWDALTGETGAQTAEYWAGFKVEKL